MTDKKLQVIASSRDGVEFEFTDESRLICFVETAENIDPTVPCEGQWIKNKWVYAFGSMDGTTFSRVWEIKTDSSGKQYATYELTEDNYANRPKELPFDDYASLPEKDQGNAITIVACVSEIRLPVQRIFDKKTGLLQNPLKRCSNIDNNKEAIKELLVDGRELIFIVNPLLRAELLRERFNETFTIWEQSRTASWLETDDTRKREKLINEFGSLVHQVIEVFPDYRRHLRTGEYAAIYEQVSNYIKQKATLSTKIDTHLVLLCQYITSSIFSEMGSDYSSLIIAGEDQPEELYQFEERVSLLIEDFSRFPHGCNALLNLFPKVTAQTQQTWLQDILLLRNTLWNADSDQEITDSRGKTSAGKTFQNYRKIFDSASKIVIEALKAGVKGFKPSEMRNVLQKVITTTGMSLAVSVELVKNTSTAVKPFQKVFFSFDENSFWRFKIKPDNPVDYSSSPKLLRNSAEFLKSQSFKNMLLGLEGVALMYNLADYLEKSNNKKASLSERINIFLKILTYSIKFLPKTTGGAAAIGGILTSSVDCIIAYNATANEFKTHDYDAAVWNGISAIGNVTSGIGYISIVAALYAGAAASCSTGVGIPAGLLLVFIGSVVAIAAKGNATAADNTPLENMILETPWGINAIKHVETLSTHDLQLCYIKAMRVVNLPNIDIDPSTLSTTIHLKRIEPSTIIKLHEVTISVPTSSDGSSRETSVVGKDILLTDKNCNVTNLSMFKGADVQFDILTVCPSVKLFLMKFNSYFAAIGKQPTPDYIKIIFTVDIEGDGVLVLPDENKKIVVEKHYGKPIKLTIL